MLNVNSGLYSLLKVGAITAGGAFFGALSIDTMPTTLLAWKAVLAPALGAALAAEIYYLRTQFTAALAGNAPAPAPSQGPAPIKVAP